MVRKQSPAPLSPLSDLDLPSPLSRRDELLDSLLTGTTNQNHLRILNAYKTGGTVDAAEQELGKIAEEIIHEA